MHAETSLFLLLLSLLFSHQDALSVGPKMVTVEYENDRVRALRIRVPAHERLDMHSHPGLVAVAMTPNTRRVFLKNGTQKDAQSKFGEVTWRQPETHAVENLGDAFENIDIEIKKATDPVVTEPPSPAAEKPPVTPGATLPVEQEPHHRVLFRNQYVCVLDVQLPPGETLLFHTHSYDNLSVRISGGLVQNQMEGSEWPAPTEVKPGAVAFAEATKKPYTHRVKNVGTSAYHVIDIELLQ